MASVTAAYHRVFHKLWACVGCEPGRTNHRCVDGYSTGSVSRQPPRRPTRRTNPACSNASRRRRTLLPSRPVFAAKSLVVNRLGASDIFASVILLGGG